MNTAAILGVRSWLVYSLRIKTQQLSTAGCWQVGLVLALLFGATVSFCILLSNHLRIAQFVTPENSIQSDYFVSLKKLSLTVLYLCATGEEEEFQRTQI